jgi:zinc D-Ala-D-Ala dipeptidase
MKPYLTIPIIECGEPLVPIVPALFLLTDPHPYQALGAVYGASSPWLLRRSVLEALITAQTTLCAQRPELRLKLFDAYRPNAVQAFMVAREFRLLSGGREPENVPEPERAALWAQTYRLWALPSDDPATPPPHSTGAAVDVTVVDAAGQELWFGSPIDENSARSMPDYFSTLDPLAHANRGLLHTAMAAAGFVRHAAEWWHFSLGDQMWAWSLRQRDPASTASARYGRASADILRRASF